MSSNLLLRAILIFGSGLVILGLGLAAWLYLQPPTPAGNVANNSGISSNDGSYGGPFTLTSHEGERVSRDDFAGKWLLIYFGYTFCPDVCPTSLTVMTQALDRLEETEPLKVKAVQPLFITIDPERDSVQVLKDYVGFFHPNLVGLTGSPEEIKKVAGDYRIYAQKVEDESATDYLMDHTSAFVLLNPQGGFVRLFTHGTSPQEMAEALDKIVTN